MCECNFPKLCGKNIPVWITYLSSSAKIRKCSNSVLVRGESKSRKSQHADLCVAVLA